MFLFQKNHVKWIMMGTKTQTRRNHKKWRANVGAIHQVRTELFGKPHCRIKVINRWEERLCDISMASAIAEGGYTPTEYMAGLIEMHNGALDFNSVLKVYEFELVKGLYPYCPHCGVRCGIDNADQWICPECNRILGQATLEEAQAIAQALYGMEAEP